MKHADRLERWAQFWDAWEIMHPDRDAARAAIAALREVAELRARMEDARKLAVYYATNGITPLEGAVRECVSRILAHPAPTPARSKSQLKRLAAQKAPAPATPPEMEVDPCPDCGSRPFGRDDVGGTWRWAGDCWQHRCANVHPQAGHFTMPRKAPAPATCPAVYGPAADNMRDREERREVADAAAALKRATCPHCERGTVLVVEHEGSHEEPCPTCRGGK